MEADWMCAGARSRFELSDPGEPGFLLRDVLFLGIAAAVAQVAPHEAAGGKGCWGGNVIRQGYPPWVIRQPGRLFSRLVIRGYRLSG
jgi:hypothetical protein